MNGKNFLKKESIILKIVYALGVLSFLIHLNALTIDTSEQNLIFPIIAFSSLAIFFIRLVISESKDNEDPEN